MNKPVSSIIAKLLKEKECYIPAFYYYENEKLIEPYLENGSSTDVDFRVDLSDLQEYFGKWSKRISAPTIADVVMWLYEKHGIWVYTYFLGLSYSCYVIQKIQKTNPTQSLIQLVKDSITYDELFNSPTEAYEFAIEYALNNLI
jgi:hypothetical protein